MEITYIHHSSFLVETASACLLFDYFEGSLPPLPKDKPLYVLASHNHGDHFSDAVFSLGDIHPDIRYLLSYDIGKDAVPDGCSARFLPPRTQWQDDILWVETFRSTDEGVAFWCRLDGRDIYHAGDLNHWYWEGEDAAWLREMTDAYHAEIALMAGRTADVAFLPADPRLEDWFYLGVDDFMKQVDARHIFPMHVWGDFSVCARLAAHPCSESYRERIVSIKEKGQRFSL